MQARSFKRIGSFLLVLTIAGLLANASAKEAVKSHTCDELGLTFSYPATAEIKNRPDKDTLLSVAGLRSDGLAYEIRFSANDEGTSPVVAGQLMDQTFLSKLPGYKKLSQKMISLGSNHQLQGYSQQFDVIYEKTLYRQNWVHFINGGKLITMVFSTPQQKAESAQPMFDNLLASVKGDAPGQTARYSRNKLAKFTDAETGISLNYPEQWRVENEPDEHTIVKMRSENSFQHRELSLSVNEHVTPEALSQLIEHMGESKLKNYRKIKETHETFGVGKKISGVRKLLEFKVNGVPALQQTFCFAGQNKSHCLSFLTIGIGQEEAVRDFDEALQSLSMTH